MLLRPLQKQLVQFFQLTKQLEIQNHNKNNNKEELRRQFQGQEEDDFIINKMMYLFYLIYKFNHIYEYNQNDFLFLFL